MKDVIVKKKTFDQPIDVVWKAISEGAEISKWFIHADFKPEPGYRYTFTAKEEHGSTVIKGTVLEADPYTLKYTWNVSGAPVETTVTWMLEKIGSQTHLKLEHTGISKFEGETAVEMFGHFEKGWDACISGLLNYMNDENTGPVH